MSVIWSRCVACWRKFSTSSSHKKKGDRKICVVQCCLGPLCIFCQIEDKPVKCLFCPNFDPIPSIDVWKTEIQDLRALNSTIVFQDWEHYLANIIDFAQRFEHTTNMRFFLSWAGEHHPETIIRWFNVKPYDSLLLFFNKLMSLSH